MRTLHFTLREKKPENPQFLEPSMRGDARKDHARLVFPRTHSPLSGNFKNQEKQEKSEKEVSDLIRPRLKSGVAVTSLHSNDCSKTRVYVGNAYRGITFTSAQTSGLIQAIINSCDGKTTLAAIAHKLSTSLDEILTLVEKLIDAQLLDSARTTVALSDRSFDDSHGDDTFFRSLASRITPELELTTWYEGVRDGGISTVHRRVDFPILIFGARRIAINTAALLHASGFQSVRVIPRQPQDSKSLVATFSDIAGGYLRPSDCGVEKTTIVGDMNTSISLFPYSRNYRSHARKTPISYRFPRLIISVGWPRADYLQRWMSENVPFLVVDEFSDRKITIGPLVQPGVSACLECIRRSREREDPLFSQIADIRQFIPEREVPASLASFVAGVIALDAIFFSDTGRSDFLNSQVIYSLDEMSNPLRYRWGLHPECTCHG